MTARRKRKHQEKYNFEKITGIVLTGFILTFVIIGLFYTPYDPDKINAALKNNPPTLLHPFGTDYLGRDILSRVMVGTKTTFFIGLSTVLVGGGIGTFIGAVTGYFGGYMDELFMRINDAITAFPSILLALVFVGVIGSGKYNIILALGIIFIPSFARVMRSEFLIQRELDYVKNAKLMGASAFRIIFVHILPNTKNVLLPALAIGFNNAVLAEAGMSYLSLGVQPPDASLGRMLSESQSYLLGAPWFAIAPGMIIIFMVLGFGLLGRTLEKRV